MAPNGDREEGFAFLLRKGTRDFIRVWPRALAWGVGTLLWIALHVALVPYLIEDSYIHFRVAEQLIETGRPYFNAGEAVKTSSSTPWTWLLSLLFFISPRNLTLVASMSAIISAAGAASWLTLLNTLAVRRLTWWEAGVALIAYLSIIHATSVTVMETALALLFATLGLTAFARKLPWAFAFLSLAAMTRIELAALLCASAATALATRTMPWRACVFWASVGALPVVAFDLIQYQSLVPQAAIAKPIIHQLPLSGVFSLLLPEALPGTFFYHSLFYAVFGTVYIVVATRPLLSLEWSRRALLDPAIQVMGIAAISGIGIVVTYGLARGIVFPWYRPIYFSLLLLPGLISACCERTFLSHLLLGIAVLPMLFDLVGNVRAALGRPELARHFLEGARARHTASVAADLYREYPRALLMTSEIGAVGFGFRGKVLDGAGIASPEALRYYPLSIPDERYDTADAPVPLRYLKDRRPGLVIAVDRHLEAVLSDPVRAEYVHVRRRLYDVADEARRPSEALLWESIRYLDILIRKDLWASKHPPVGERP